MSDEMNTENKDQEKEQLALLKQRATLLGVKFSNNISIETLKAKIKEHMEPKREDTEVASKEPETKKASEGKVLSEEELKIKRRNEIRKEATKLIRVRITNHNPAKSRLPGEIFTVANSVIGTVRKFIPYDGATENGYHIPKCIYDFLKTRKFVERKKVKTRDGERMIETPRLEFAIEVLPPLTPEELKQLALQQAAAAGKA